MIKSGDTIEEVKGATAAFVAATPAATSSAKLKPFLVSPHQVSQQGGTKELVMHCLMYGTSLYSELSEFRNYFATNTYKVQYASAAFSQVQLFLEFLFEVINERDEPLVFAFELIKCACRLREYRALVRHERLNVLIDMDAYKQFKLAQEHEDKVCSLIRAQKQIEKPPPDQAVLSLGLHRLRQRSARKQNVQFSDEKVDRKQTTEAEALAQAAPDGAAEGGRPKRRGLFGLLKDLLRFFGNLLLNSRFSIDELISIARPVIYMYAVLRLGRRSYRPLKISLLLDVVQITFSVLRLWRSNREKKKVEAADQTQHTRPKHTPLLHRAQFAQTAPEIELSASSKLSQSKLHFLLRNVEV